MEADVIIAVNYGRKVKSRMAKPICSFCGRDGTRLGKGNTHACSRGVIIIQKGRRL